MLKLGLLLTGLLLLAGCKPNDQALTRTEYAYRLLDDGKKAEAVFLLEEELEENPENNEARTLLGSALIGLAGVDVYSIFENFQDLIFNRSLKDSILNPKKPQEDKSKRKLRSDSPHLDAANSNGLEGIARIDALLVDLQNAFMYLNRFPTISRENWILVEEALGHLTEVAPARDIAVYRVFIRLIYIKSFLVEEMVLEEKYGFRNWVCTLSMAKIRPSFEFIDEQITHIFYDLDLAVSMGAKRLIQVRNGLSFLKDSTEAMRAITYAEGGASLDLMSHQFKELYGCSGR